MDLFGKANHHMDYYTMDNHQMDAAFQEGYIPREKELPYKCKIVNCYPGISV